MATEMFSSVSFIQSEKGPDLLKLNGYSCQPHWTKIRKTKITTAVMNWQDLNEHSDSTRAVTYCTQ